MAAVTEYRVLNSPTQSKNHGKISDSECHNCCEWKSEIKALKSEVKSMSEIIKILTEESNPFGANKENNKLTYTNSVSSTQCGHCNQQGKISNSECHNCSEWKGEIQTLKSEIKSLSEIIKILTEEAKPLGTNKETNTPTHMGSVSTTQYSKCNQLELQLQTALNEVSSLKAIINLLNEDSKLPKPITKTGRDMPNPWTVVLPNTTRGSRASTLPKPSSHETFYGLQYAVPTTNRYAALSNSKQTNDTTSSPDFEQQPRRSRDTNLNYAEKHRWKKSTMEFRIQNPTTHPPIDHYLQEANRDKEGPRHIPTIVNGVVRVNSKVKKELELSDTPATLLKNTISNLRLTIKNLTDNAPPPLFKHRIILLGDSHLRGYARSLQSIVNKDYDILGIVKPGSCSNELKESIIEDLAQCSPNDLILINTGTNDLEHNGFMTTFQNIKNFLVHNKHSNLLLMSIPFRYDLPNSHEVNKEISALNNKLEKLVRVLPHVRFIHLNNDRNLYTKHGLHHNRLGKMLISLQLAKCILTTFAQNNSTPTPLRWYDDELGNSSLCNSTQTTLNRKSIRNRKTPITRSNDFLWMP